MSAKSSKPRFMRLDAELVRRGLARSRGVAAEMIARRVVRVSGRIAEKPATSVELAAAIEIRENTQDSYVSRGAQKLIGALEVFDAVQIKEMRCLDAGASTGGFTDVLLRREAASVTCVDVGYGQLSYTLAQDPRVTVLDRTNVRMLTPEMIGGRVDLTVADLSFISLKTVLPALSACTAPDGVLLPMVKPQFEVGRDNLSKGGVVRDPQLWAQAVCEVSLSARELGWAVTGMAASPLPGPSGNREFFCLMRRGADSLSREEIEKQVRSVQCEKHRACDAHGQT